MKKAIMVAFRMVYGMEILQGKPDRGSGTKAEHIISNACNVVSR